MKDILIFISDQHSPLYSSFGGGMAQCAALERICREGCGFSECYTSCPLCVPARMSMLTGRLPSANGVMTNLDAISNLTPTFLHSFAEAGYETVLIGRMHFVGRDQRHGFTKRLARDMTPVTWNRPVEKLKQERGVFDGTYDSKGCVRVTGGGESPVIEYDRFVTETALKYLEEEHERPQLIVVGTYAPHFPYVAPLKLYRKYRDRVSLPWGFHNTPDYFNDILKNRTSVVDEETVLNAQAAYLGLIEFMDGEIGQVREAFSRFTNRRKSESLFCYVSDHGDQVGERDIFGKFTFFEKSAKIPFVLEGDGIPRGRRIAEPASIMDLGPTLMSWAGVEPLPDQDGQDLLPLILGKTGDSRMIVSEMLETLHGEPRFGLMLRTGRWKYIVYSGAEEQDILFDLEADPGETVNVIGDYKEEVQNFRAYWRNHYDFGAIEAQQKRRARMAKRMAAWERLAGEDDSERWKENPEYARQYPVTR